MGLTNDVCDLITSALVDDSYTPFDNSNAAIGVGDSTTDFSSSQSDLQGSNEVRKGMNSDYPTIDPDGDGSDSKIRFESTFDKSEANFKWEEWGVFNDSGSGSGTMLNREVEFIGEKTDKAQWTFQVDVELVPA